MSNAEWQKILAVMAKVEAQERAIAELQAKLAVLEQRPRVGRPPKEAQAA